MHWQCHFSDQILANAMQSRLGDFLHGPVLQVMADVFERVSPPDEVWKIDILDIDLGILDADASLEQWCSRLEQVLWERLLRERHALEGHSLPTNPGADFSASTRSALQHDLGNFLFYLENGHLPWAMSPLAGPSLADWLVRLARRTGPSLWIQLQQLRPGEYVLARLSQIAPYQGLQALLEIRHAGLAEGLLLLDQQILAPLRARGRLSAYQVAQIQQKWRVAGLSLLWREHSSQIGTTRVHQLIGLLGDAVELELGDSWTAWLPVSIRPQRRDTAPTSELSRILLAGLIGRAWSSRVSGFLPTLHDSAPTTVAVPLTDGALMRLDAALGARTPLQPGALPPVLEALAERDPEALRQRLRYHTLSRASRMAWWRTLGSSALWMLLQQLAGAREHTSETTPEQVVMAAASPILADTWAESLRQFSLKALKEPEWQVDSSSPVGVSRLQSWLVDYTLRYLAAGNPLPQDHVAWQALWQLALQELGGQGLGEQDAPDRHENDIGINGVSHMIESVPLEPDAGAFSPRPARSIAGIDPSEDAQALVSTPSALHYIVWRARLRALRNGRPIGGMNVADRQLIRAYLDAMAECAGLSQFIPPSLCLRQFQSHFTRRLRNEPEALCEADLARSRVQWKAMTLAAQAHTHTIEATVPSVSMAKIEDLLQQWARGDGCIHNDAWWQACHAQASVRLAAQLQTWVKVRGWLRHVSTRWPCQQKLELLVLLGKRPATAVPAVGKVWSWQIELSRWQWLPALITQYARTSSGDSHAAGAGKTVWCAKLLTDWLWEQAFLLVAQSDDNQVKPMSLVRHWRRSAQRVVAPVAAANQKGLWQSWPEVKTRLLSSLSAASKPTGVASAPGTQASSTWSVVRMDALVGLAPEGWTTPDRLWVAEVLSQPAHCAICLSRYTVKKRWDLLAAQFPVAFPALRDQSDRLACAFVTLYPHVPAERAAALHWNFLFSHCFLAGLPVTPACLARRYAMHLAHHDQDLRGAAAASFGHWLSRLSHAMDDGAEKLSRDEMRQEGQQIDLPELQTTLLRVPSEAEQWEAGLRPALRPAYLHDPAQAAGGRVGRPESAPMAETQQVPSIMEAIPIDNAGLVLLASYCQRLFSMLGLLHERAFVDEAAQNHAVHCLAFMIDGSSEGNETSWVLNKLLCGIPINRPVPPAQALDDATQETLESLLKAVIAHWKTLGNTSVAGLRETFLQREGRLTHEQGELNNHWRLKVKQAPFDMLLDLLPWSYSTIKLPWMEEVLYVEWR